MDERSMDADQSSHKSEAMAVSGFFERTIVGVLTLLARSVRTVGLMLFRPRQFGTQLSTGSSELAAPYSFLVLSLLFAGIAVRLGVSFFDQHVDHSLLSSATDAVGAITLEDVFVLTVPGIVLVAMAGTGIARWLLPDVPFQKNVVVKAVCYAAALQFSVIGAICLTVLISKIVSGKSSALPGNLFDQITLVAVIVLLCVSTVPVFMVARSAGTTRWARNRVAAMGFSGIAMATVLIGVSIINSISFDLSSTIAEARYRHQLQNRSGIEVAIRTLDSRMVKDTTGRLAIQMNIGLVNVTEHSVIVPRPFQLENAHDPTADALQIISCSSGPSGSPGWVIEAGDTQLVQWTLSVPDWCMDARYQQNGLPVSFNCFPYYGVSALSDHEHPIGRSRLVYGELSWPMSDAWRNLDQERVHRLAEMISGSVTQ